MSENSNQRSAYVYPVKSLLTGRIQPATDTPPSPLASSRSSDDIQSLIGRPSHRDPSMSPETPRPYQSAESVATPSHGNPTTSLARQHLHQGSVGSVSSERLSTVPRSRSGTASSGSDLASSADRSILAPLRRPIKASGTSDSRLGGPDNPYFPPTNPTSNDRDSTSTSHPYSSFLVGRSSPSSLPSSSSSSPSPPLLSGASAPNTRDRLQFVSALAQTQETPHDARPFAQLPLDTSGISYGSSALPIVASGALSLQSPSLLPSPPLSGVPPPFAALRPQQHRNVPIVVQPKKPHSSLAGRGPVTESGPAFKPNPPPAVSPPPDLPLLCGFLDDGSEPGLPTLSQHEDAPESPTLPFNPSQYGLVHLPPLPASNPASSQSSASTGSSLSGRAGRLDPSSNHSRPALGQGKNAQDGGANEAREAGGTREGSLVGSNVGEDEEMYTTVRFRHIEDENGNHIVVGREGDFQKCEDEPIRTPGAVQGFGVLIAVDEMEDTLVVRQVSENSTELLGLPPKYLFGLECFTDTLPEAQASALWNNIQFLKDPDLPTEEEQDHSPHIFLLTGWGAPDAVFPHDDIQVEGRKSWTCWCAVHRAMGFSASDSVSPGVIILEFELERDVVNPLYPPVTMPATAHQQQQQQQQQPQSKTSGMASPAASTPSTDASDKTLFDNPDSIPTAGATTPSRSGHVAGSSSPYSMQLASDPASSASGRSSELGGLDGDEEWMPSIEDIIQSTTSWAKPLPALERLRRTTRGSANLSQGGEQGAGAHDQTSLDGGGRGFGPSPSATSAAASRRRAARQGSRAGASVGMMDVFAVMAQINEQLGAAPDLDTFLKVVVGVLKDLTQFHRVMIYQFDELWNGQVVAELVDWSKSHDLYMGLHFPAGDIPAQARALYAINKVRLLYDRAQTTARIVVRNKYDLEKPLVGHFFSGSGAIGLTMTGYDPFLPPRDEPNPYQVSGEYGSPCIHVGFDPCVWEPLGFSDLPFIWTTWNESLISGSPNAEVDQSINFEEYRKVELRPKVAYKEIGKFINTLSSEHHPTGYIVSNADDLLGLFDADFGILVVGEGAKILGQNQNGQELLIMAEYLRLKQFNTIQASQAVTADFPDLQLTTGLEVIAGLLYVPLSSKGKDFIAFLRRGQPKEVRWAGKPHKQASKSSLEPRASFKIWSETVAGRCRAWTDVQLETAGVLALVYGKFIEVWREKESALQSTKLTNLLLSNASHEVRTPLNHIINYLEMALNGPLDHETRDNLKQSHTASKSLLFTINDLLDLTRLESGNETSFNEPFNLPSAIEEATYLYRKEAERRNLKFNIDLRNSPAVVVGDVKKIQTVVQNLTANSLKYTSCGEITVRCSTYREPEGLRDPGQTAVEIVVGDTGTGMSRDQLDSIFREFEQVDLIEPKPSSDSGVGLGLAVVARIVEQLGGQLKVESKVNEGSQFSFLIPLELASPGSVVRSTPLSESPGSVSKSIKERGEGNNNAELESLVNAISSSPVSSSSSYKSLPSDGGSSRTSSVRMSPVKPGEFPVVDSSVPVRPVRIHDFEKASAAVRVSPLGTSSRALPSPVATIPGPPAEQQSHSLSPPAEGPQSHDGKLRVLIVEDNNVNRMILAKRLTLNGHTVVNTTNGQEGLNQVEGDRDFDVVLMDIQMPILNGFEATQKIRELEKRTGKTRESSDPSPGASEERPRLSHALNGRIPIFAVSASLVEQQRDALWDYGLDGWILKPIDFKRLEILLKGVVNPAQREQDVYRVGCSWEAGGWLKKRTG